MQKMSQKAISASSPFSWQSSPPMTGSLPLVGSWLLFDSCPSVLVFLFYFFILSVKRTQGVALAFFTVSPNTTPCLSTGLTYGTYYSLHWWRSPKCTIKQVCFHQTFLYLDYVNQLWIIPALWASISFPLSPQIWGWGRCFKCKTQSK